jgi:hypothetical protein
VKAKILLVSHDPGGISSLSPLVPALAPIAEVKVWLHPLSAALYNGLHRSLTALNPDEALNALAAFRPDVIITGTSMGPDTIDKRIVAAAEKLDIPTIAFVDFWSNYLERFTHTDGSRIFPDLIATIDAAAKAEMIVAGIPEGRIEITGILRPVQRLPLRPANPAGTTILFISQALAEVYGGDAVCRTRFGYTQHDAFNLLAAALPAFEASLGHKVELNLRHHPKEKAWTPDAPHKTVNHLTAEDCLGRSDIVTGMTGSLLIDALLMGLKVVSIQPDLIGPDLFMPSRQGYVALIRHGHEILPALTNAFNQPQKIPPSLAASADGQAITRFTKLITSRLALTLSRRLA